MANNLYIASLEPASGKSVIALGVMELLSRRLDRVGYFRPVVPSTDPVDSRLVLMDGRYELAGEPEERYAFTVDEVERLLAQGRTDELFKGVLEAYRALADKAPFVLCDGTDYTGVSTALEFEFNAKLANHLGAPVLAIVNGRSRTAHDVVEATHVARESLTAEGCTLLATVVNRVDPDDLDTIQEAADAVSHDDPIWVVPEVPTLSMPTVREVATGIGAKVLLGDTDAAMDRVASKITIAAMTLPHVLDRLVDGAIVLTPGDRADVLLGVIGSRMATTFPNVAAVVLTGGYQPEDSLVRLLDGFSSIPCPVLSVDDDTYGTATDVNAVPAVLRPRQTRKIATALDTFEAHVDIDVLANRIEVTRSTVVTPLMFEFDIIERARQDRRHIVLPESSDDRILRAAEILQRRGVATLTLLGNPKVVETRAATLGVDLTGIDVIDPATSPLRKVFADRYAELRAHKGATPDLAFEMLLDVSYFGTMMVLMGHADGMVSGAAHTTQHTVRPSLEVVRTKPGVAIVSSVFFMLLPDRVLVYGDCAINPNPDASQLADIAISSAETAAAFGVYPRIAMLSYSTGESGQGTDVKAVREATELVRQRRPDLQVEGPMQYDAAVDVGVGEKKLPGSQVAGNATVFIFPDLNTGNNTYKAVQRSAGAVAVGPVLQGLNKPVNDLSRGCTIPDIVNTVAITAIQAQQEAAAAARTQQDQGAGA
ncbi:phosphate acetyltransferase [Euzebya pacifica]|uniref:phosphate acetyltransferase n=1 Tax=Euzebya pacifica TaxID=1608957 RepID=UPI0030F8CDB7